MPYEYSAKHQATCEAQSEFANSLRGEVARAYANVPVPADVLARIAAFCEGIGIDAEEVVTLWQVSQAKRAIAKQHDETQPPNDARPGERFEMRVREGKRMNSHAMLGS